MKNWKAIVGAIAVFVLGAVAGGLVTVGVVRHQFGHGHGGQMMANFIVRRLTWKLDLDSTQREQLRAIVHDSQQDMKAVRRQMQPRLKTSSPVPRPKCA